MAELQSTLELQAVVLADVVPQRGAGVQIVVGGASHHVGLIVQAVEVAGNINDTVTAHDTAHNWQKVVYDMVYNTSGYDLTDR